MEHYTGLNKLAYSYLWQHGKWTEVTCNKMDKFHEYNVEKKYVIDTVE